MGPLRLSVPEYQARRHGDDGEPHTVVLSVCVCVLFTSVLIPLICCFLHARPLQPISSLLNSNGFVSMAMVHLGGERHSAALQRAHSLSSCWSSVINFSCLCDCFQPSVTADARPPLSSSLLPVVFPAVTCWILGVCHWGTDRSYELVHLCALFCGWTLITSPVLIRPFYQVTCTCLLSRPAASCGSSGSWNLRSLKPL